MSRPVVDGQRQPRPSPVEVTFRDIQPYPAVPQPIVVEMLDWEPRQFVDTELDEGEHE